MLYWLLLVALLALTIFSFVVEGHELFAPAPLCLMGLTAATLLAIVGMGTWNGVDLRIEGFSVVAIGAASLACGSAMVRWLFSRRSGKVSLKKQGACQRFFQKEIATWKYLLVAAIILGAIALRIYETMNIAAELGVDATNFSAAIKAVRYATSSHTGSGGVLLSEGFSFVERQLEKVVRASGYVSVALIAGLLVHTDDKKVACRRVALPALIFLLSCVFILVSGSRATVFYYVVAGIVAWFIFKLNSGNEPLRLSVRVFLTCLAIAVIGSVAFYLMSAAIGRSANSGIVEYVSYYYGCGIPGLQQLIDAGIPLSSVPGSRTFYDFFAFLYKFGLVGNPGSSSAAWVQLGDYSVNVFTAFSNYFFDYGYVGLIALSLCAGGILSAVYRWARGGIGLWSIVVAGYFAAFTFDMARVEFVFSAALSPYTLITLAAMLVITVFLAGIPDGCLLPRLMKGLAMKGSKK